jgi:hypothetical protein
MRSKVLAALSLASLTTACGLGKEDAFREASPSRQNLKVAVAGSSSQALEPGSQQQGLGQIAEWYRNSVSVAMVVNGGLVWVSNFCEGVLKYPATTVTDDTAVWGPFTEPLAADTFKFTITKSGDSFDYRLEGRPKAAGDEAFVKLIYGTHTPGLGAKVGQGTFTVDWEAAQSLVNKPKERGTATYTYERTPTFDLTIGTAFKQVRDEESGQLVDANYSFEQRAAGNGALEYAIHKDIHNNGSKQERSSVKTRWEQDGRGRSDLTVSGGDLTGQLQGSQCWNSNFQATYYADSVGLQPAEGSESSCAFATADYSTL